MSTKRSCGSLRHPATPIRGGLSIGALLAASVLVSLPALAQTTPGTATDTPESIDKARAVITEGERKWVDSVVTGKVETVKEIFADDLVGVDSDGNVYDKPTLLAELREAPKYFTANRLNVVNIRFFGNTAVAQGDETFARNAGEPKRARFVFTDTWIYRDGAWKVVATEAVVAPETAK